MSYVVREALGRVGSPTDATPVSGTPRTPNTERDTLVEWLVQWRCTAGTGSLGTMTVSRDLNGTSLPSLDAALVRDAILLPNGTLSGAILVPAGHTYTLTATPVAATTTAIRATEWPL